MNHDTYIGRLDSRDAHLARAKGRKARGLDFRADLRIALSAHFRAMRMGKPTMEHEHRNWGMEPRSAAWSGLGRQAAVETGREFPNLAPQSYVSA